MKNAEIWILEPEQRFRDFYTIFLPACYDVKCFEDFLEFESSLLSLGEDKRPALIISELICSGDIFFELVTPHQKIISQIPVIIVSSTDSFALIERAYDFGVVDYFTKPVGKDLLLYKIEQAISLNQEFDQKAFFSKLRNLTLKERMILESFLEQPSWIVRRKQILDYVWQNISVSEKTLDVHLYSLRKKIRPHGYDIESIGGSKFKFLVGDNSVTSNHPSHVAFGDGYPDLKMVQNLSKLGGK